MGSLAAAIDQEILEKVAIGAVGSFYQPLESTTLSLMKVAVSKAEELEEKDLKVIIKALEGRGWNVRREKLSRGPSFRVKSGSCEIFGEKVIFLDKNLPNSQQLNFAVDYCLEHNVVLEPAEIELLSAARKSVLTPIQTQV